MMSLDKSKVPAIYDVTLAMPVDDVATMSTMLLGKKATGHMYVRRFDVNTLPTGNYPPETTCRVNRKL